MVNPVRNAAWILLLALAASLGALTPPNLEEALQEQLQLAVEEPGDPTVHNDLGNLLLLADDLVAAEAAYRRAVGLDAEYADAWFNLGLLLQQTGRDDEAMDVYQALIDLAPSYAWAHYQLGALRHANGDQRKAIESYARSFALDTSLTFPEVNPHIIDNSLFTQALLRSSEFARQPAARTPRQYAQAGRIRGVMLEALIDEALELDAEMELDEREAPVETTRSGTTRSGNSMELGTSAPIGSASGTETRRRVTREDLGSTGSTSRVEDGRVTGVAVGVPRAGTASRRSLGGQAIDEEEQKRQEIERARTRRRDSDPPPTVYVPPQRRGASAGSGSTSSTEPASRRRYRPGRDSTASLDLRLESRDGVG